MRFLLFKGHAKGSLSMTANPQFETLAADRPASVARRAALLRDPKFGTTFTDHMVTIRWSSQRGWHDARVEPLAPLSFHPATSVFHYAQEVFEGLKAYRGSNGDALLFRPLENARRFNRSAARMAMPALPEEVFLEAIERLVSIDNGWIPEGQGALYLRPFMVADEVFLGVRPAEHYLFCVIASPAGSYFNGGATPITIWVSETYSRAARGGTGEAKCGGNYAASLAAQSEAIAHGCDQVVFLDAAQSRWIEELGGMNIFFVMSGGVIVTPPLGTILPGITRDAVLRLARDAGYAIEERPYALDEWRDDATSGRLEETFVCGTAATIVPVGSVRAGSGGFMIAQGEGGPVTASIRASLVDIQRGRAPDPRGWNHRVVPPTAGEGVQRS